MPGQYDASQITVLEGLEPVRKRPGMYIGGTGIEGLHHLIWEIFDNAIDEAMAGYANKVTIELLANGSVAVRDNGRGIPTDLHPTTKVSALETVLTKLHAGGKFGGGGYKVSGGLHGVGLSVVNALSDHILAEVFKDGKRYYQECTRGIPDYPIKEEPFSSSETGTKITFTPDPEIFPITDFSRKTILDHLRQQAYLTKGIRIEVTDNRDPEIVTEEDKTYPASYTFHFEGGIAAYVAHLVRHKKTILTEPVYVTKQLGDSLVEVSFTYVDDYNEHVFSFANNIHTTEGGTHLTGFRSSITRVITDYAKKLAGKDSDVLFTGEDIREGLTAVISVKLPEPEFEGQTKSKLGTPSMRGQVESVVNQGLTQWMEEHPNEARAIIEKISVSAKARLAARAARDAVIRKGALEGMTLPGKLADCSEKDAAKSEIYIVEGDSAGGCFSGDTKVALADGRNLSFVDLVSEHNNGKQNYCYTTNDEGAISIVPILNPRLTKQDTEVIELTLVSGESIVCTPDHLFMLGDLTYIEAQKLTTHMSLASLVKLDSGKNVTKGEDKIIKINNHANGVDVYDLEVEGTHNFALASGVFVHNSAKQGRDRRFQAILPLKGKILNVERARLDRMLNSDEIKALIVAMGVGVGDEINMEKMRYHRVIIMTDADVDGAHIRTLLLTFFYRHYPEVILRGYLYIAQPPLYGVKYRNDIHYVHSEDERDRVIEELRGKNNGNLPGLNVQRYKGLGEMNPQQLWDTTLNPENRVLLQVKVQEAEKADGIFSDLMGDEVAPRKRFINTRAKFVKNIDLA